MRLRHAFKVLANNSQAQEWTNLANQYQRQVDELTAKIAEKTAQGAGSTEIAKLKTARTTAAEGVARNKAKAAECQP